MLEILPEYFLIKFLLILLINITVFYLINSIILKNNLLIDLKNISSHKKLLNLDIVPISGGIILLLNLSALTFLQKHRYSSLNKFTLRAFFIYSIYYNIYSYGNLFLKINY